MRVRVRLQGYTLNIFKKYIYILFKSQILDHFRNINISVNPSKSGKHIPVVTTIDH